MSIAPYQRIVVAVDFSPNSRRAVHEAARIAGDRGEVILVHATLRLEPSIPWSSVNRQVVAKLAREAQANARKALTDLVESMRHTRTRTRVVVGIAHEKILAEAKRAKADLLVVGARGHTLSERLMIGSTAERILRKATLPVLVIPGARKG